MSLSLPPRSENFELNWPVTEKDDWWFVNSKGKDYDESLVLGCREMCRLMQPVYNWDPTDIFIYLSLQGDVEINQACRPMTSPASPFRP